MRGRLATLEPRADELVEDLAIQIDARELLQEEQSSAL